MAWFRSFSMGAAAAKPGMPLRWAYPMAVRFNGTGDRFVGVGDGGLVATWRLDAPRGAHGTVWADWTAQGLAKKGCDVAYVAGSSSVVAVGGAGTGGNIAVWDSLAPAAGGCVATMTYHTATVTRMCPLPGVCSACFLLCACVWGVLQAMIQLVRWHHAGQRG